MATATHRSASRARTLRVLSASACVALYLSAAVFPLILLLLGPIPRGGGRPWDFAMALGFAGLALMGLQFVLTARFRRLTAPFGMDIIYYFHRWAALGAFALLVVHYAILRIAYRPSLGPANPFAAPWHMTSGRLALVIFAWLIVSSLWRKQLRLEYDRWRFWHGVLSALAVLLAILHIQGVAYYTRAPWKARAWLVYSLAWLGLLVYIRALKPWLLSRKPWRIVSIVAERGDSWTLTLAPLGDYALHFAPGQFAWLTLRGSPFRAVEHPFSFSGDATQPRALQFTIKELGDFTRTVKSLEPDERAYVDGPHGTFSVDLFPNAAGFCFVAGGVGIAPIASTLRTLASRADPRPLFLFYGNAIWERVIFRDELETLVTRLNLKVVHVIQRPPPGWSGATGFITQEILERTLPPNRAHLQYFLCGPVPMTGSVTRSLRALNVPRKHIHFEHFDMA